MSELEKQTWEEYESEKIEISVTGEHESGCVQGVDADGQFWSSDLTGRLHRGDWGDVSGDEITPPEKPRKTRLFPFEIS